MLGCLPASKILCVRACDGCMCEGAEVPASSLGEAKVGRCRPLSAERALAWGMVSHDRLVLCFVFFGREVGCGVWDARLAPCWLFSLLVLDSLACALPRAHRSTWTSACPRKLTRNRNRPPACSHTRARAHTLTQCVLVLVRTAAGRGLDVGEATERSGAISCV